MSNLTEFRTMFPHAHNAPGLSDTANRGGVFERMTMSKGTSTTILCADMMALTDAAVTLGNGYLEETEIYFYLTALLGARPTWEEYGQATNHVHALRVTVRDSFGQGTPRVAVVGQAVVDIY